MEASTATEHMPAPSVGKKEKEKRFQCQHCQRMFARLEHLQRHERIHSGVKPFSCAECNYSFTRSDLLVRHERLTHHKENGQQKPAQTPTADEGQTRESRPSKRLRSSFDAGRPVPQLPSMMPTPAAANVEVQHEHRLHPPLPPVNLTPNNDHEEFSLAALSMAAEYQALHGALIGNGSSNHEVSGPMPMQDEHIARTIEQPMTTATPMDVHGPSLGDSLDSLAAFLDNESLSTFHYAGLINTEQPMPFFSPESFNYGQDLISTNTTLAPSGRVNGSNQHEETTTFSRFGSRLPSLQPDDQNQTTEQQRRLLSDVSIADRQMIADKLEEFASVLPHDFRLPTRLALCRYLSAYISGFHEHMPFLHFPTMTIENCSIELILALAAVGAQYTFEGERAVEIFHASRAIATHRIRRRDARLVQIHRRAESDRSSSQDLDGTSASRTPPRLGSISGPLGLPSHSDLLSVDEEDLMQTAQALLLLMALCTWAKHKEILREALAIQSILATLIRDDGLQNEPLREKLSWEDWVRRETVKRTKFIVYGFSNLHCIVYNIPPFILTSEIKLTLPCSASEFKAPNEKLWREARKDRFQEIHFQEALQRLFSKSGRDITEWNSSAGNYALIHAIIQHIFFARQVARGRFDNSADLSKDDVVSLENALRNWQIGWTRNPESSLDPMSQNGPVAFNSTALLRLAYIRLYVDTAGRALETRDPVLIANALRQGSAVRRTTKITRAVLHSAHALSIPIKIGYRLVAKTQFFIWSIQHSLCTLECASLLSKWLEALSFPNPDPPISEDERRIAAIVRGMLDETEFALPANITEDSPGYTKHLSAGVLRVWATIFRGAQTWAIVDVIGNALNLYADMVEAE
ncbi:hypothetical protein BU24DRAFT_471832 [Aaosphaeria arxii CBS 175.79]|uniref:C2H2-type domain-containing protein n=1 Tax=Aaosphaeria arxii CBS 175.79 TaxID=1450172 RepID=A0A6A5XDA8_9PLEO|nr:uncharacterized protein BU24DRAFT_471832 [Aaosphaeria arxii CBS 175.79]KAF2010787.1 hypothetical protein BU24DRAFT_471832 [Aaosphaeria arxii CBS 175.79]